MDEENSFSKSLKEDVETNEKTSLVSKFPQNYESCRNSEEEKQDQEKTRSKDGFGVLIGATFLVGELAGGGILNMPQALAHTGWSGIAVIIICASVAGFSASRLALSWVILEEQIPYYRSHPCKRPYQVIAEEASGKYFRYVTEVCLVLTLFGSSVVDLLLMAEISQSVLSNVFPDVTVCSLILVIGMLLIPVTFLGTPKDFWASSIGAMLATVFSVIVIGSEALTTEPPHYNPTYPKPTFISFFIGLGSILFSFGGTSSFPTIQNDMADRNQFPKSILIGFIGLILLYVPFTTICYSVYGAEVQSNILLTVSGPTVMVTEILLLFHFLFAFLIIINPVMQSFEDNLKFFKRTRWYRYILRSLIMLVAITTAEAMPGFDKILDLIGGFSVSLMTFVFPPIFYIQLAEKRKEDGSPYRQIPSHEKILLLSIVLLGIIGGGATTYSAMEEFTLPGIFEDSSCLLMEKFF